MTNKRVVLDRQHLVSMVGTPEFYIEMPEFLYLQQSAKDAIKAAAAVACDSCGGEWAYMRAVIDAMFAKLQTLNADELGRFKQWLAKRKGYPISEVVIYYRRASEGRIAKFKF